MTKGGDHIKKLVIFKDKDTIAMSMTTDVGEFYSGSYKLDNTACARCFNSLTERAGLDLCIDAEDSICFKEFMDIMCLEYVISSMITTPDTVEFTLMQKVDGIGYLEEFLNDLIYYSEEF